MKIVLEEMRRKSKKPRAEKRGPSFFGRVGGVAHRSTTAVAHLGSSMVSRHWLWQRERVKELIGHSYGYTDRGRVE